MSKKGKGKVVSSLLFFVVSFAMGIIVGIIIDSKILKSNNQNTTNNNTIIGKIEIDNKEISDKLFSIINNNNFEKVIYNYRSNGTNLNDITNDEKLFLSGIDKYYKSSGEWVSFDTLKDNLIKAYGTDYDVKGTDYNFHDIAVIKYKDGNYEYDGQAFTYSDTSMFIDLYNYLKLEKEDNTYYLTVTGIYHQIIKDVDNYTNDKGFIFNEGIDTNNSINDLYKSNPEQFMKYTFIFENKDSNYILNKFSKIN